MWRGALKPGATSTIAVVISELEFGTSVLLMMVRLTGEGVSGGFFGGSSASASAQLASKAAIAMHVLAMVPLRLPQLSGGILAPHPLLRERAADAQS